MNSQTSHSAPTSEPAQGAELKTAIWAIYTDSD